MHLLVFSINFIHLINASSMKLANWKIYYLIQTDAQNKMGCTI